MANILRDGEHIRKAYDAARKGNRIDHIWGMGFPAATDHDTAITEAERLAKQQTGFKVLGSDIIETADHVAAGEFMVRVVLGEKRPPGEKDPDDPEGPKP